MNVDYPKLRHVEAFPVKTENGQMFALRDPSGIATSTLAFSPDIFYILQFLDGKHSLLDLRTEYKQAFGSFLEAEKLDSVLDYLNDHFFLDNPSLIKHIQKLESDFFALPFRPAAHAGMSYEEDPVKLKQQLESFFELKEGAGFPNGNHRRPVKGLVAPHIDIRAGGACYTHAYRQLAESGGADCFVILGTGHAGLKDLYSTIAKDFDTPFGTAKCDSDFINLLAQNYPEIARSEVLPHKNEHVIEFQLVFLKYLYEYFLKSKGDFTFVPILCSFSYHALTHPQFSREKEIVQRFSQALKKTIAESGKKVCIVASVDFCHVGPQYGDEQVPDHNFMTRLKAFDESMISTIEELDAKRFCQTVADHKDQYRVCGFSSIYTMLNAIEAHQGQLLDLAKTEVDNQKSTVTFASMVFD